MAILVHKCPHCLSEHMSLEILAYSSGKIPHFQMVYLKCPKCLLPSSAELHWKESGSPNTSYLGMKCDPTDYGWKLRMIWPKAPEPEIPRHLPPEIERTYLQAERNLQISGNEEAAGIMYRKSLDVGLKRIDTKLTGTLAKKIKSLAETGKLTSDLAEWSNGIRSLGNEAAHEVAPFSRDDLKELRNFTEMVLRYLFSLPNAIKLRRGEKLDWDNPDGQGEDANANEKTGKK